MSTRRVGSASDPAALASALRALGLPCDVESRAGLAVVSAHVEHIARLAAPDERAVVVALAREHGFTHVAVEVQGDALVAGAPLLRG